METKFNYFLVGAFVLVFTCAMIIWGAWLFSNGKGKVYNPYLVYMQEAVSGLNVNAPVKYNGVDVGYVDQIGIDKKDPQRVRLLLQIEAGTPITLSTTATMMTQGLTGISYIGLRVSGTGTQAPLRTNPNEKYPVIKSTPSLLLQLDTAIRKVVFSFENINAKISELLTPANREAIARSLKNIDTVTAAFAKNDAESLATILDNGAQASTDLNPLLTKLNESASDLSDLTQAVSNNPSVLIRGQQPPPLGPGE